MQKVSADTFPRLLLMAVTVTTFIPAGVVTGFKESMLLNCFILLPVWSLFQMPLLGLRQQLATKQLSLCLKHLIVRKT